VERNEVIRRFRLVVLGYLIIGLTLVAGLAVDWNQTQDIKATQNALIHDTESLARAIANGQTYLCDQLKALSKEVKANQTLEVRCFTQQQRYGQIIHSLESH
jgi:hypothetical protein